jgi:hypothetical protein
MASFPVTFSALRSGGAAAAMMLLLACAGPARGGEQDGERFFRERIEPVLQAECYRCHSAAAKELQAGLLLDSRAGVLHGGDSGPVIDLKSAGESLLLRAIRHEGGLEMPPDKPQLASATIADFARWIELGAPDPRSGDTSTQDTRLDEARRHWAFQPVRKSALPAVSDAGWVKTPVDAFVLAALEERQWRPAEEANRADWIRRVTFDLTGLPPTPEEVQAFVADASSSAYEQVVDRLLESPRYGERWAQHWLDVVRFAESEGYEYDRHLPEAWRYRDYVIDSFNRDKPFARFVTEQLAGDELAPHDRELQTATIFHRLGPVRRNAGNPEIALSRNEVLTERTNVIGEAFLGLTVGCARCHNHKLEPISQMDYYRLQAYVAATEEQDVILATQEETQKWEAQTQVVKDQMAALKEQSQGKTGEEKARLLAEIAALEEILPPQPPTIPGIRNDFEHFTAVHVLRRGVWEEKGDAVGPRPLAVLIGDEQPELPPQTPHPRTELAKWLTDPEHPLTARVIVNRLWQHHFGDGLVKTASDFGTHGGPPSHGELLDWLAAMLVENGWRLKPLHRLIVLSSAYRQSSRSRYEEEYAAVDPENRLLWRFNRRRLAAEELRDAMLAVSGRLNLKAGGPSVITPVDSELVQLLYKPSQWKVTEDASEHDRRSIYLIAKRNLRLPFMEVFDAPALQTSCPQRAASTHAPQALELLNGELANDLATAFAERLRRETTSGEDPADVVERAYWMALGREPTVHERELSVEFLREAPLEEFALAMFNLNGFLYVP